MEINKLGYFLVHVLNFRARTAPERLRAGSGCLDAVDGGLTGWGTDLVAELNRAGIVPDGSHCSVRTGLGSNS